MGTADRRIRSRTTTRRATCPTLPTWLVMHNQRRLYDVLFRAALARFLTFAADSRWPGAHESSSGRRGEPKYEIIGPVVDNLKGQLPGQRFGAPLVCLRVQYDRGLLTRSLNVIWAASFRASSPGPWARWLCRSPASRDPQNLREVELLQQFFNHLAFAEDGDGPSGRGLHFVVGSYAEGAKYCRGH